MRGSDYLPPGCTDPDGGASDFYVCSVCGEGCVEGEVDDDASQAFEHVCKRCAEQERAQHAEEDEQVRGQSEPSLVETVMATIFAPDVRSRLAALRENHERNVTKFGAMSNAELAEKATLYLHHSQRPNHEQGSPVYDVVMHDVIVPEMIRRLRDGALTPTPLDNASRVR